MPLYTFRCSTGHEHDALGAVGSPPRPCPECSAPSERLTLYGMALVGEARVPNDQKMVDLKEFTEATAELEYDHNKYQNEVGHEVEPPSTWKASQAKARDLQRRGVKDSSDFRGTADGELKHRTRFLGTRLAGDAK